MRRILEKTPQPISVQQSFLIISLLAIIQHLARFVHNKNTICMNANGI